MIHIKILNRDTNESSEFSYNKESLIIGRMPGNDIFLDSSTVSRKHAEILKIRGHYYIVDLESGNGTFFKGSRLKPNEKQIFESGESIRIEHFEIIPTFEADSESKEEQTDSGIIEIKMIKKVLGALDTEKSPSLQGISEPIQGKIVFFTDSISELVIGREANCNLNIDSNAISRRHAVIQKKWGGITITDLKSKNGTFINGVRIEEKELHDGDKITLGDIDLIFKNPLEIDLDALTKEYEKNESVKPADPPEQDEIATGLIDANTGENAVVQKSDEQISPPEEGASESAKISVDHELSDNFFDTESKDNNDNLNNNEEQNLNEEAISTAHKESKYAKLLSFVKKANQEVQKNYLFLRDHLNHLLKDFTPIEKAIFGTIVALVILSILAFIIVFS